MEPHAPPDPADGRLPRHAAGAAGVAGGRPLRASAEIPCSARGFGHAHASLPLRSCDTREVSKKKAPAIWPAGHLSQSCLLYTSDAADE